jgi:hypothetical protein
LQIYEDGIPTGSSARSARHAGTRLSGASQDKCIYPRFDDENNLSMALLLKCHGVGVMFPGDLEKD